MSLDEVVQIDNTDSHRMTATVVLSQFNEDLADTRRSSIQFQQDPHESVGAGLVVLQCIATMATVGSYSDEDAKNECCRLWKEIMFIKKNLLSDDSQEAIVSNDHSCPLLLGQQPWILSETSGNEDNVKRLIYYHIAPEFSPFMENKGRAKSFSWSHWKINDLKQKQPNRTQTLLTTTPILPSTRHVDTENVSTVNVHLQSQVSGVGMHRTYRIQMEFPATSPRIESISALIWIPLSDAVFVNLDETLDDDPSIQFHSSLVMDQEAPAFRVPYNTPNAVVLKIRGQRNAQNAVPSAKQYWEWSFPLHVRYPLPTICPYNQISTMYTQATIAPAMLLEGTIQMWDESMGYATPRSVRDDSIGKYIPSLQQEFGSGFYTPLPSQLPIVIDNIPTGCSNDLMWVVTLTLLLTVGSAYYLIVYSMAPIIGKRKTD